MYDARQYCVGAFQEIASYVARKYGVPRQTGYRVLLKLWERNTSAYAFLFNDLLTALNIDDRKEIKALVKIFNGHRAKLKTYPRLVTVLRRLQKQGYYLGIITDGNVERQARKIEALGVKPFFDVIIYTEQFAAKPSPRPFMVATQRLRIHPGDALYVGDNPPVDFRGAKTIGMRTVRISRGEFKHHKDNKYIDWTIHTFDDLLDVAAKMRQNGGK